MNTKKILALALAAVLLVAVSVAGTVAYLTAESDAVTNIFTPSEVGVSLVETTGQNYQFVPGVDLEKDPKVTATADVDCYVFVEITETNWPTNLIPYDVADGWEELDGVAGVYYRECTASETAPLAATWSVLDNDTIEVPEGITLEEMKTINQSVKLEFQAYIIQKANGVDADGETTYFDPADAWAELNRTPVTT